MVQGDIFSRIQRRVGEEKQRVAAINGRVESARLKVKSIAGSTKATTVFSTAKYPAPRRLPDFKPIFWDMPPAGEPAVDESQQDRQFLPAETSTSTPRPPSRLRLWTPC
jgi:WAS family protein 1